MRIDLTTDEGVGFLKVDGDLDIATADELREAGQMALTDVCGTLRIDLADVAFLDSTGIGALIAIRNRARAAHAVVVLDHPSAQVRRVLGVAGLLDTFGLAELPTAPLGSRVRSHT